LLVGQAKIDGHLLPKDDLDGESGEHARCDGEHEGEVDALAERRPIERVIWICGRHRVENDGLGRALFSMVPVIDEEECARWVGLVLGARRHIGILGIL